MWQILLSVFGVGGRSLQAVNSFYIDSRACVRLGMDESEWFKVMLDWERVV